MEQLLREEIQLLHSQMCQCVADPTRIMILYVLNEHPRYVGELASDLSVSQPTISRHLKILRDRGLVTATREGQSMLCSLNDHRVIEALDLMRAMMADVLTRRVNLAEGAG
ncbi:MAG: metalloregulator ArsR/SmtB family transcription factor [Anaerolineae bacterium]|nr:metalloregulator ArsR/SmtB family transcription factor [Anaerolineae bacterium]